MDFYFGRSSWERREMDERRGAIKRPPGSHLVTTGDCHSVLGRCYEDEDDDDDVNDFVDDGRNINSGQAVDNTTQHTHTPATAAAETRDRQFINHRFKSNSLQPSKLCSRRRRERGERDEGRHISDCHRSKVTNFGHHQKQTL